MQSINPATRLVRVHAFVMRQFNSRVLHRLASIEQMATASATSESVRCWESRAAGIREAMGVLQLVVEYIGRMVLANDVDG